MKTIIEYLTGLKEGTAYNPSITIYSDYSGIIRSDDNLDEIVFDNKNELFNIINNIEEIEIKL